MISISRQRNFGLLWFAGLISMIRDWVLFIALPLYTHTMTRWLANREMDTIHPP